MPKNSLGTQGAFSAFAPVETCSNPGTTTSMQDIFDNMKSIDIVQEDMTPPKIITKERSQSFEDDSGIIRLFGDKLLRKSTQGFLLLRARNRRGTK